MKTATVLLPTTHEVGNIVNIQDVGGVRLVERGPSMSMFPGGNGTNQFTAEVISDHYLTLGEIAKLS